MSAAPFRTARVDEMARWLITEPLPSLDPPALRAGVEERWPDYTMDEVNAAIAVAVLFLKVARLDRFEPAAGARTLH